MSDVWESFKERITDPFLGRYAVSFGLLNWRCLLALFGNEETKDKVELVTEYFSNFFGIEGGWAIFLNLIVPAIVSLILIYFWPKLSVLIKKQIKINEVNQHNALLEEEGRRRNIQIQIENLNKSIAELRSHNTELQKLLKEKIGKEKMLNYVAKQILDIPKDSFEGVYHQGKVFGDLHNILTITSSNYSLAGEMASRGGIDVMRFLELNSKKDK